MNKLVSIVIVSRNRKKDLIDCVNSILQSTYRSIECIIVDNDSDEKVLPSWWKKNKLIKIYYKKTNTGAAGGRNIGIANANGHYFLFMDDDATAEKKMISELVKVLDDSKKNAGVVQPLIYDKGIKDEIQGAGHQISLWTGRISACGVHEKDIGQYNHLREIPLAGCIWMAKKEVINKIGGYDEEYFIPYEDSDFSMRARKVGYAIYCVPNAVAWHQGKKTAIIHPALDWLGITTAERSYRLGRNKIIFMRKHAGIFRFIFFLCILLPIYVIIHSIIILSSRQLKILLNYWIGIASGLVYVLTQKPTLYANYE